jgi:hypothetical protein
VAGTIARTVDPYILITPFVVSPEAIGVIAAVINPNTMGGEIIYVMPDAISAVTGIMNPNVIRPFLDILELTSRIYTTLELKSLITTLLELSSEIKTQADFISMIKTELNLDSLISTELNLISRLPVKPTEGETPPEEGGPAKFDVGKFDEDKFG